MRAQAIECRAAGLAEHLSRSTQAVVNRKGFMGPKRVIPRCLPVLAGGPLERRAVCMDPVPLHAKHLLHLSRRWATHCRGGRRLIARRLFAGQSHLKRWAVRLQDIRSGTDRSIAMSEAPLIDSFAEIEDSRCSRNTLYPIEEILLLVICGAISGADDFVAIAEFGESKLGWLRGLFPFENGIPVPLSR